MPLINHSLPNLVQGVSQQADALRFEGQCDVQENALSSIVAGLQKRPNTRHLAKLLSEGVANDSKIHFINRDDDEKFVIIHSGTKIRIFNLVTGAQAKIKALDHEDTTYELEYECQTDDYNPGTQTGERYYCASSDPRTSIKFLTISDTTFILNKNKIVEANEVNTANYEKAALVFVKQGDFGRTYQIEFGAPTTFAQISFQVRNYVYDDSDD